MPEPPLRTLASTANDGLLVSDTALSGNPSFLVARYEYTPGFSDIDDVAVGGRAHYWIDDSIKITVPQVGANLFDPSLTFVFISEHGISHRCDIFSGVKPVYNLDGFRIVFRHFSKSIP